MPTIYLVVHQGEVVYATTDYEDAAAWVTRDVAEELKLNPHPRPNLPAYHIYRAEMIKEYVPERR